LRPAAFFCAVVPPWDELPPEPELFPPRLDAPGEFAILAARDFDIPLSLRASYCFSFLTFALLLGTTPPLARRSRMSLVNEKAELGVTEPGRIEPRGAGILDL
jgi:hypothetical protein